MISNDDLLDLVNASPDLAVSLYLPTQRLGRETRQNPIMLKNLRTQAREQLDALDRPAAETEALLAPLEVLIEDHDFWQNQEDGLAIFLDGDGMRIHKLPAPVAETAVAGAGFHITPLLPLMDRNAPCLVMAMTADTVQVWRATRFGIEPLEVPDLPASVEDLDGEADYEAPVNSHGAGRPRTGGHGMPKTQVFGDSPEEWRKGRLVEYVRRSASGLAAHVAGEPADLVIVADAEIGGQLRNAEALADLIAGHVETNPAALSEADLHAAARSVMEPIELRAREDSLERLQAHLGRGDGLACTDPAELVAAAHAGRIDQLFLADGASLHGTFDAETGLLSEGPQDLADQAAQMTLRTGGGTWIVEPDHLPEGVGMAAILRY
ncbi:hypothetical protein LV780_16480 [Cereibacter azotoformans]|uniref:baeRF3 domain-containing protein n=1 Tax=Cereibacter azotoformans TaxID=43057 RepID=UPI001F3DF174|nr:hypothetical protein [Cereibacter azotoformans]UIJ32730.1 hypothetical protein LV780_16480 [Cereibacter azotoformans]